MKSPIAWLVGAALFVGSGAALAQGPGGGTVSGEVLSVSPAGHTVKVLDTETSHVVELSIPDQLLVSRGNDKVDYTKLMPGEEVRASFDLKGASMVATGVRIDRDVNGLPIATPTETLPLAAGAAGGATGP